jgi:hypothetical protein
MHPAAGPRADAELVLFAGAAQQIEQILPVGAVGILRTGGRALAQALFEQPARVVLFEVLGERQPELLPEVVGERA